MTVGAVVALVIGVAFARTGRVSADGETINGSDSFVGLRSTPIPINDIQITGSGNPTLPVRLNVSHGTLAMGTTTGLTFDGASTGATLEFSGSLSNLNVALATLTYTRTTLGSDTLEVSLVEAGQVFFPENNHLYEYVAVPGNITWTAAQAAAAGREKYGADGYLTTITSQQENDFVAERLEDAGWMGASDSTLEGDWKWVTGPENGTSFWSGNGSGSTVSGRYANWNNINLPNPGTGSEPNNSGNNEHCGQFLAGSTGLWNDLPCTNTLAGYVVEYGASGDLPEVASHEATIYTVQQPDFDAPNSDTAAHTINLDFTLYSTPLPGSLKLTLSGGNVRYITLDDLGVGQHSFSLNPANVLLSPNVASASPNGTIPDDTYVVVELSYTDAASGYEFSQTIEDYTIDTEAPTAQSFTPADNINEVAINANLVIHFDELVGAHSGDIVIYRAEDDTVFETIPAGGGPISGNGTDTITLNPFHDFEPGTDYYVLIDAGAITDLVDNDYAGISSPTAWSFRTLEAPQMQCAVPTSTQTTIQVECDTIPDAWGATTWEVRYRKTGTVSYTSHSLTDDSSGFTTIPGLTAETEYEIQIRFTNDYGVGDWENVTATTADDPDNDDDGLLDTAEDTGPNGGDANNDGMLDSKQAYVAGFLDPLTSQYAVLAVDEDCTITAAAITAESANQAPDSGYQYPAGLMDFTLNCGNPGFAATITQYYYGVSGDFIVRKYHPETKAYQTISSASVVDQTIASRQVKVASYQVVDGGELDADGQANGQIIDPAGLAQADSLLANTGSSQSLLIVFSLISISLAAGATHRSLRQIL